MRVLHFVAKKFARVSSKVCPNERSDCSRRTLTIAQLKNTSKAYAVLLIRINRSCSITVSIFLIVMYPIIDLNSLLKTGASKIISFNCKVLRCPRKINYYYYYYYYSSIIIIIIIINIIIVNIMCLHQDVVDDCKQCIQKDLLEFFFE